MKPQLSRIPTPMKDYRYTPDMLAEQPNESYGHKMRRLRLALGLSQGEVAEIGGTSKQTVGLWERDKRMGNSTEAAKLPRRIILLLSARLRNKQRRDAELSKKLAKLPVRKARREA